MVLNLGQLPPWLHGPLELMKHAQGHLLAAGDTDRRIALIGFDNAIEVCIDVYIRLHPKLRGGLELTRETVEKARRNYHTKLEFLDAHLQSRMLTAMVAVDHVLWFHELRNELYHSGNGMIPELHVIEGARNAALAVFQALFGVDAGPLLGVTSPSHPVSVPAVKSSNELEFLRVYIDLERVLRDSSGREARTDMMSDRPDDRPMGIRALWSDFVKRVPDAKSRTPTLEHARTIRNRLVHGDSERFEPEKLEHLTRNLSDFLQWLKFRTDTTE